MTKHSLTHAKELETIVQSIRKLFRRTFHSQPKQFLLDCHFIKQITHFLIFLLLPTLLRDSSELPSMPSAVTVGTDVPPTFQRWPVMAGLEHVGTTFPGLIRSCLCHFSKQVKRSVQISGLQKRDHNLHTWHSPLHFQRKSTGSLLH